MYVRNHLSEVSISVKHLQATIVHISLPCYDRRETVKQKMGFWGGCVSTRLKCH